MLYHSTQIISVISVIHFSWGEEPPGKQCCPLSLDCRLILSSQRTWSSLDSRPGSPPRTAGREWRWGSGSTLQRIWEFVPGTCCPDSLQVTMWWKLVKLKKGLENAWIFLNSSGVKLLCYWSMTTPTTPTSTTTSAPGFSFRSAFLLLFLLLSLNFLIYHFSNLNHI